MHLQYQTAFRYLFHTPAADIDADLQVLLRFY
jgi:hypothetical protein